VQREPVDQIDVLDSQYPDSVTVDWMADHDALIDVRAAIRRLPWSHRGIMLAFYEEDLSQTDIAARYRVSDRTVRNRLRQGEAMVKDMCR